MDHLINIYKTLDKFIQNTPKSEIEDLISQVKSLNIKGPTFNQYLKSLNMNTINNPLIISYNKTYYQHHLSKNGDQSGEYIDKALAKEMLEALEKLTPFIEHQINLTMSGPTRNDLTDLNIKVLSLISKAKG